MRYGGFWAFCDAGAKRCPGRIRRRFRFFESKDRFFGVWRSPVARFVRDEEVVGSNPATPTIVYFRRYLRAASLVATAYAMTDHGSGNGPVGPTLRRPVETIAKLKDLEDVSICLEQALNTTKK